MRLQFERETEHGKIFRNVENKCAIGFEGYEDGNLKLDIYCGNTISDCGNVVEELFSKGSNINEILKEHYVTDTPLNQVSFDFNGVQIIGTFGTTSKDICKQLDDGYEALRIKREAEYEEYKKTPQYQIDMAEKARKDAERKMLTDDVIRIDKTTELEFKNEEAEINWNKFVEINSKDGYSAGVVEYARRWAKYMQSKIANGERLVDVADSTSHAADIGGITGFMYGCAVNALSQMWKHGEELRKWHNKEWGHEGDGVVNPAVFTIG